MSHLVVTKSARLPCSQRYHLLTYCQSLSTETLDRDSALIKLAGTLGEALQADCRRAQFTVGMDLVAEKIKSFFGSADISFYRMQAQLQDSEHLIHLPYRLPELLSGFENQLFHPGFSLLLLSHASL